MIRGTKNASGGPKLDIGGPCPKPYINITFWGDFFSPRGRKTSFGVEKCDLGGNFDFFLFWSDPRGPGRLRNLNIPIGILRFSACGGQGTTRILQKVIFASFCRFSRNSAENGENLVILWKLSIFCGFLCFRRSKPLKA